MDKKPLRALLDAILAYEAAGNSLDTDYQSARFGIMSCDFELAPDTIKVQTADEFAKDWGRVGVTGKFNPLPVIISQWR